ncbi:MAG: transglycosylase family protein [Candidatus Nanopelagicales bacterium]
MNKTTRTAAALGTIAVGAISVAGCYPTGGDMFSASRAWASGSGPTKVRICESGNNYSTNTGNGYYGAWQFDYPSWHANGGGQFSAYPNYASKDQQDYVAYTYWQRAGWGPWACKPW